MSLPYAQSLHNTMTSTSARSISSPRSSSAAVPTDTEGEPSRLASIDRQRHSGTQGEMLRTLSPIAYELSPAHWNRRQGPAPHAPAKAHTAPSGSISQRIPGIQELDRSLSHPGTGFTRVPTTKAAPRQLPLSVYESPTATYTWPRFNPIFQVPQTDRPLLYVAYKPAPASSPSQNQPCSQGRGKLPL